MKEQDQQPDGMGGIAAVVLCAGLLAFITCVPARQGASPGGKFFLAGLALMGIGWGAMQIRAARAQDKREAETAKKDHDTTDA